LNRKINVGDFLLVSDQINLTGFNPLTGPNYEELGIRFPVMFDAYSPSWRKKAKENALKNSIYLYEGVYAGISGPNFVTRAELRYLNQIGADCVGMSLVQESIAAVHSGMEILAVSAVTSSDLPDIENYDEEDKVIENYKKMSSDFVKLLKIIIINE
jgi:purine-nucleoside phosphorylase